MAAESDSRCSRPKAGKEAYNRRAGGGGGGGGGSEKSLFTKGGTQPDGALEVAAAVRRLLSSLGRPVK